MTGDPQRYAYESKRFHKQQVMEAVNSKTMMAVFNDKWEAKNYCER